MGNDIAYWWVFAGIYAALSLILFSIRELSRVVGILAVDSGNLAVGKPAAGMGVDLSGPIETYARAVREDGPDSECCRALRGIYADVPRFAEYADALDGAIGGAIVAGVDDDEARGCVPGMRAGLRGGLPTDIDSIAPFVRGSSAPADADTATPYKPHPVVE